MKAIIIHGCPTSKNGIPTYNKHWIPWTKKQLECKSIKTEVPLMPDPWDPIYKNWKKEFEKHSVDKNTILIGHSGGTTFLVRWLGETKQKIKKLILVAPWKIQWMNSQENKEFCDFTINPELRKTVGKIVYFTSNDEEIEGKKSLEMYHKILDGKIISLKNHGHYVLGDMGTEEFPELIEEVLS